MQNKVAFNGLQNDYAAARPNYPIELIKQLPLKDFEHAKFNILDVGCGTGIFTQQLAQIFSHSRVFGCDINADMIAEARKGKAIDYKQSIAEILPYDDGVFNIVTAAQAIQWFDRAKFYQQAKRVLHKNGLIVIIENNRSWQTNAFLADYEALLEQYAPSYDRHYRNNHYMAELKAIGFDNVQNMQQVWQRQMMPSEFIQMARSSTKMQAALKHEPKLVMDALNILLSQYANDDGILMLDYVTQMIVGVR